MRLVRDEHDWLKLNTESSEVTYLSKLDKLKEKVRKTRQTCPSTSVNNNNNNRSYGAESLSISTCLKKGEAALASENYEAAQDWFLQALKQISREDVEEKCRAILKVGQTFRGMAENQMMIQGEQARDKVGELLKTGASYLVLGLKIGPAASSNVKIVAELDKIKDMIFEKVKLAGLCLSFTLYF